MAYKEIKLDSAGAKALSKALAADNDAVVKGGKKKKSTVKKTATKKSK